MLQQQPTDASRAQSSPLACTCAKPIRLERAERKGASETYCARCGLPVPPRIWR